MEWLDGCQSYDEPALDFETFFGTEDTLAGSDSDHGYTPSRHSGAAGGVPLDCSSSSCSNFTDSLSEVQMLISSESEFVSSLPNPPTLPGLATAAMPYLAIPTSTARSAATGLPSLSCPPTNGFLPIHPRVKNRKPTKNKLKAVRRKRLLLKAMKDLPKLAYDELTVMPRREMRSVLEFNDQNSEGNKSDLMVRITDCYLHGSLPICPKCKHPNLVESNTGSFFCTTEISGVACTYDCDKVERKTWRVRPGHNI